MAIKSSIAGNVESSTLKCYGHLERILENRWPKTYSIRYHKENKIEVDHP